MPTKASALTELTTFSGDETFYVVEDDDGTPVSRRVTVENLAAGLAPWVVTSMFLPAAAFVPVNGAPVLGEAGTDVPAYLLDAASTERIATVAMIPAGWVTFNIVMVWSNGGAGSGNVVWNISHNAGFGDGESATVTTTSADSTVAAPVTGTAKFTTLESGLAVPSAGELMPLRLARLGTDAGDTLANDAGVLGLRLVKAS